uniref:PKD-like domain-containing protein n=1 Tax=Flavobacterium sp. TaxID=239 RepID=UPI0037C0AAA5
MNKVQKILVSVIILLNSYSLYSQITPSNTPQNVAGVCTSTNTIDIVRFQNTLNYFQGGSISVFFKPNGIYELNNQFILELSDASGSFTNPVVLSTKNEFFIPILKGIIPIATPTGNNYKLRVRTTNPVASIETNSFQISGSVLNSTIPLIEFIPDAPHTSLDNFTKCIDLSNNYYFGYINRSSTAVTPGNPTSTTPLPIEVFLQNSSDATSININFINAQNNIIQPLFLSDTYTLQIPHSQTVGYYLIEIIKNYGTKQSVSGFIFLHNTGSTGLANTSNELVCVGESVNFIVDAATMATNYPNSLYSINYGDGSPIEYLTHNKLMLCPNITNQYDEPTCDTEDKVINADDGKYYFKTDLILYNKGLYNSITSNFECNNYFKNGAGTTKWVNVSLKPAPDFIVAEKICAGSPIFADENSINGLWGSSNTCNEAYSINWYIKSPTVSTFSLVNPATGWINSTTYDLTIPGTSTANKPGCWQIQLTVGNNGGCTDYVSIIKTVIVEPQPDAAFTYSTPTNLCAPATLTFTNTSNTEAIADPCKDPSYTWTVVPVSGTPATATGFTIIDANGPTPPAAANQTSPQISFTQPGTYTVTLTVTNVCGTDTFSQDIEIIGDPSVSFSPDNLTICQAQPPSYVLDFSDTSIDPTYSAAPYTPASYNWAIYESNGTTLANTSYYEYTLETSAISPFPKIKFTQYGVYVIKVTVNGNCGGANTASFTFTFKQSPIITNTGLNQTICSNSLTQAISLTSDIIGTTFEWVATTTDPITGFPSGIQTTSTIPAMTLVNNCNTVGVVTFEITPKYNGCEGAKVSFTITVNPKPQIPNGNRTICSRESFSFIPLNNCSNNIIVPINTVYTYTVVSSDPTQVPAGSPRTVASAANITDVYTNTTVSDVTITYTITPIGQNGCSGNPFTLVVTVKPEPVVADQAPIITCSDVALNYDLDALIVGTGDTYTYTVVSSNPIQVPAGSPRTVASSANITNNYTNTTGSDVTITYTITPIGQNGCSGNPFTLVVTVKPEPVVSNQTVSTCSNVALNYDLGALISGTGDTYTYTVASSNPTLVPAGSPRTVASATNITDVYTNTSSNNIIITYTITPIGQNGCSGNPFTLVVTVKPEPVVSNQTASTCSDVALNYDLGALIAGTGDTYTYTVVSSDPTQVPAGSPRTVASAANITDVYTNTTGSDVTITYTITPIGQNGCSGNPFTLVVTVKPEPVVANQAPIITCSDVALNYDLGALIAGTGDTYIYTVVSSNPTQVPAGSPRTVASSANITNNYTNTTGSDVTITYTITPIGQNGCSGNPFTLVVTVKPEPVVSNQTVSTCSNVALNYDLGALISGTGDTYTYTVASSNPTLVPAGSPRTVASAANITDVYTNTSSNNIIITYTITPIGQNGCSGNPFTLVVTVKPEPVVSNQTAITCSDVALNYDLGALIAGTGDTYTYTVVSSNPTQVPAGSPRTVAS